MIIEYSRVTKFSFSNLRRPIFLCSEILNTSYGTGEYLYLNAQLHQLGRSLESDVGAHFVAQSSPPSTKGSLLPTKPEMVNVWFGSKGSTAAIHHDPFENFFVQIYGRKRFYLFPPSESSNLALHPKTHPKNRQSQVNLNAHASDTELDRLFPNLRKARGIEVRHTPKTSPQAFDQLVRSWRLFL